MLSEKELQEYKVTKEQIISFNNTGIIPFVTSSGEINMNTGEFIESYKMSAEVKQYIHKQLGINE